MADPAETDLGNLLDDLKKLKEEVDAEPEPVATNPDDEADPAELPFDPFDDSEPDPGPFDSWPGDWPHWGPIPPPPPRFPPGWPFDPAPPGTLDRAIQEARQAERYRRRRGPRAAAELWKYLTDLLADNYWAILRASRKRGGTWLTNPVFDRIRVKKGIIRAGGPFLAFAFRRVIRNKVSSAESVSGKEREIRRLLFLVGGCVKSLDDLVFDLRPPLGAHSEYTDHGRLVRALEDAKARNTDRRTR